MARSALYVAVPDGELLWTLKHAALDERVTVRKLVSDILVEWLRAKGYAIDAAMSPVRRSAR
jgi:hypothetical protein